MKWKKCFFQLCRARPSLGDKGLKPKTITPLSISLKVCITFRFHSLAWNKSWSSQQAPIYLKNASSNNILHTFLSAHIVLKIDGIILSSYSMLCYSSQKRGKMLGFCYFSKCCFFLSCHGKNDLKVKYGKIHNRKSATSFLFQLLPLLLWLGGYKFTYCLWFIRDCVLFTVKKSAPLKSFRLLSN